MEPQLDFWRQLGWDMFDKTLYGKIEAGGVDGRRMGATREALRYHELVTAPKYCGKWIVDYNKWGSVKHTNQKQFCNNRSGDFKMFSSRYFRCTNGLFLCAECYAPHVTNADT